MATDTYVFTGNPDEIHMGPAGVYFDGTCLGYTLNDSVSISITHTPTPITPDQASLPIKDIITEMEATVTVTLGEVTKEHFSLLPGVTDGVFKDPIGIDMKEIAKELTLVPIDSADENIYTFPKASPYMSGELTFAKQTPQGLQLTFKVYADEDNADTNLKGAYMTITAKPAEA